MLPSLALVPKRPVENPTLPFLACPHLSSGIAPQEPQTDLAVVVGVHQALVWREAAEEEVLLASCMIESLSPRGCVKMCQRATHTIKPVTALAAVVERDALRVHTQAGAKKRVKEILGEENPAPHWRAVCFAFGRLYYGLQVSKCSKSDLYYFTFFLQGLQAFLQMDTMKANILDTSTRRTARCLRKEAAPGGAGAIAPRATHGRAHARTRTRDGDAVYCAHH